MPNSDSSDGTGRKVTVMCFFGSDNNLSPLLISQVKAIKEAGYEPHTDVLVRFDPNERSAPTRLYHVNAKRRELDDKNNHVLIGDDRNPFVRNMAEDIVDPKSIAMSDSKPCSKEMKKELETSEDDEVDAVQSLDNFVGYCLENYPADHYLLFLTGHGMIVGNDAFLPDDTSRTGISLTQLGTVLSKFKDFPGALELVGLHSCSMSSVEIAYELKGIANYVIGSQGTSFVGSWPYRQLLKKIFAVVDDAKDGPIEIKELVEKLFSLSLYNSSDFMMAGYSADMSLCNLSPGLIDAFTLSMQELIKLLIAAMPAGSQISGQNGDRDPIKDLIVSLVTKAHSESQSYWGENYTDLYDFCDCLTQACDRITQVVPNEAVTALRTASNNVKGKLETIPSPDRNRRFDNLVVRSEYFGWKFQYSHGLSIYFPWSEPLEVENVTETPSTVVRQPGQSSVATKAKSDSTMERYRGYKFNQAFKPGPSWFDFLKAYFECTQRQLRNGQPRADVLRLFELAAPGEVTELNTTAATSFLDGPPPDHKTGGAEGTSDGQNSSIKNFHTKSDGNGRRIRSFSISPGALRAFKKPESDAAGQLKADAAVAANQPRTDAAVVTTD
jgi:hypothetical protein